MVADLLALRRVPARFFGVFMSVNLVFAALIGLVVLGQSLGVVDWLAIGRHRRGGRGRRQRRPPRGRQRPGDADAA